MYQVLFTVPILGIPVFAYGAMLFVALVGCVMLATRLGKRVGIRAEVFTELAFWLFVFGVVGGRVLYIIWYWNQFQSPWQFFAVWEGGLIFYGSLIGGTIAFFVADHFLRKRDPYDRWKMVDVIAPCVALGLALGRIGCYLNGCCYGAVACESCPGAHFPLAAPPRFELVKRGYQSPAGFTLDRDTRRQVELVEPGSEAETAGLKTGDVIVKVNERPILVEDKGRKYNVINDLFGASWPRGKNDLTLTVLRAGREVTIGPIAPRTIALHPTQLYETVSMVLLTFFLVALFPYRRYDGILLVLFLAGYGVHRFLNEMLRIDVDAGTFGMTLSQNISIVLILIAAVFLIFVVRHGRARPPAPI
jgi:phosphatidylglycerol:prolipoprotein diacylglycerol transferase